MLLCASVAQAKVTLPTLLSDNAILQRNSKVLLWGTASPGHKVTITPSWSGDSYTAKANAKGEWEVEVTTSDAGEGHSITFDDGEQTTINNILLGEVWLTSGQSNMEMPMRGNFTQPVEGAAELILQAKPSTPIRYFEVGRNPQAAPTGEVQGAWQQHTPEVVAGFSATAYFFAQYIFETLGVPVGIINSSWGGSRIEAWMSREMLSEFKEYDFSAIDRGEVIEKASTDKCYLYNGMIAPLLNYKIKGMLWYQGEANRPNADEYLELFPIFVNTLRKEFNCGEFPFYYVEIAPFSYGKPMANVYMRETMGKLMDRVSNCGMASVVDCGESTVIHPRRKRAAGERLALWALGNTYGCTGVDYRAPQFDEFVTLEADNRLPKRLALKFKHAPRGVCFGANQTSQLFELAGEDRVFHKAEVRLMHHNEHYLEVWSDQVSEPVAVRYGYKNFVVGDLFNTFGVPVSSFRSDSWPLE